MRRGRQCPICSSNSLPVVSAALEGGARLVDIAKLVPFDIHQLQRHKRHSAPPAIPADNASQAEMSDARLARWMERTEQAYLAAGLQGDLRGQVDAVRSGIRAELEFRRRHEVRDEQNAPNKNLPFEQRPVTIEMLDGIIREERERRRRENRNFGLSRRETGEKNNSSDSN